VHWRALNGRLRLSEAVDCPSQWTVRVREAHKDIGEGIFNLAAARNLNGRRGGVRAYSVVGNGGDRPRRRPSPAASVERLGPPIAA
jgi:hypothetical protein